MCEHHSHEDQPLGPLGQLTGLIYVQTARLAPRDILVRKVRWVVRAVIIDPALKPDWASVHVKVSEYDGDARQTLHFTGREMVNIERHLIAPPIAGAEREFIIQVLLELDAVPTVG